MLYTNSNIIYWVIGLYFMLTTWPMYLINKPHVSDRITKSLLLFLEYDFKIVFKSDRSHLMANALNRLSNQAKPIGVLDHTIDAHLFILQLKWL